VKTQQVETTPAQTNTDKCIVKWLIGAHVFPTETTTYKYSSSNINYLYPICSFNRI